MDLIPEAVDVHIEELVLHGFDPADGDAMGDAIRNGLAKLMAEEKLPALLARSGDLGELDGGTVEVRGRPNPEKTGTLVAGALHRGLQG